MPPKKKTDLKRDVKQKLAEVEEVLGQMKRSMEACGRSLDRTRKEANLWKPVRKLQEDLEKQVRILQYRLNAATQAALKPYAEPEDDKRA